MWTPQQFRDNFNSELGDGISEMARDFDVDRWVLQGQALLPQRYRTTVALSWAANAVSVALPSNFVSVEAIEPDVSKCVPPYRLWGQTLRFLAPAAAAGSGTMLYYGYWPSFDESGTSALPPVGDQAVLAYALSCFYRRVASGRADYRRYATLTGQNAVDVQELEAVADSHRQLFEEYAMELREETDAPPAFYYGE